MLQYLAPALPIVVRALLSRSGGRISRLPRRVALRHVDTNRHMNQAAYPEVMEQGRVDWLIRTGAWQKWRGQGVNPVVADQHVTYRRELKPLQRFVVDSRAVGMDGRLLVIEHHLLVGDVVHARNVVHLIFIGPSGVLSVEAASALCDGLFAEPLQIENWRVVS